MQNRFYAIDMQFTYRVYGVDTYTRYTFRYSMYHLFGLVRVHLILYRHQERKFHDKNIVPDKITL